MQLSYRVTSRIETLNLFLFEVMLNGNCMASDLELLFHCGEEFTKLGLPHVHCIVHSLAPETHSYIVEFTATGNIRYLSERKLLKSYAKSSSLSCQDALKRMGADFGRNEGNDEDGELCSP